MKFFLLLLSIAVPFFGSELHFTPSGEILSFNSCAVSLSGDILSNDTHKLFFTYFVFGISSGIILLAAVYNVVVYFYNRQIMFLHYSLMQLGILLILFTSTGLWIFFPYDPNDILYCFSFIPIVSTLMSALFTQSFFQTDRYAPKMDLMIRSIVLIMIVDAFLLLLGVNTITHYVPFSLFILPLLAVGFLRLHQGFKPALYFLIGWGIMIVSVAISEIYRTTFTINPMMIGSPIEAILLAFALFYTLKEAKREHEEQKTILIQQSKLVSLGELLGNIAHQWRQPLTNLSYIFMNIKSSPSDSDYVLLKSDEGMKQLQFMSDTIDNFRNFYQPDTQKVSFSLHVQLLYTLDIMTGELDRHHISTNVNLVADTIIHNYKNQFIQVLLNILTNAKDALIESQTKSPLITIQIDNNSIQIIDNAGGIPKENIEKVFDPYFSTKPNNNGIGLYMSKIIIDKNMGAHLSVQNTQNGAMFTISF